MEANGNETVKAPFTKVVKDGSGNETVKAPFVKVQESANGDRVVKAPFVKVEHVGGKVHIKAPFVNKWMTEEEYQAKHAKKERDDDKNEKTDKNDD